jgi:D-alanyl-D-alanine carboxypeptidase
MPTRRALLGAMVCGALVAAGCATAPKQSTSSPQQHSLAPATAANVDAAIAAAMTASAIPGALVGIWSPEGDYVKAFGVADTATGAPMGADFYSRIGSVTKTFTATAVLQLVDGGKVRLDDPIARYVDSVPNGDAITVRQLADMRSGLADYTKTDEFSAAITANPQQHFTPEELLGWAFARPADFPPGQRVEYSNTNYIVLGLLVEKVGGQPFGDYLTEHILGPLELAHTSFPTGNQFPEPHPQGYTAPDDGGPAVNATDWTTSFAWAAGAMVSTLEDLRTWVSALATGELLSPELQKQRLLTTPEPGGPADFGYGIGIFEVAGWVGHNGSVPGYQTVAVYLPQRKITLVVMVNTDIDGPGGADPGGALATAITSTLTPDHVYRL